MKVNDFFERNIKYIKILSDKKQKRVIEYELVEYASFILPLEIRMKDLVMPQKKHATSPSWFPLSQLLIISNVFWLNLIKTNRLKIIVQKKLQIIPAAS